MRLFALLAFLMVSVGGTGQATDLTPDQQYARDLYAKVISYRTARGQQQVPALVEYLVSEFKAAGFTDDDIAVTDYMSDGEPVQGLMVTYKGTGEKKPIVALAHMDVVDALAKDWERPPFELIELDGYFFGRGTLDNKNGVVSLTQTFIRLKKSGWVPNRDLVLVFSGDEESGMISTRAQAKYVAEHIDPEYVLNSDAGGAALMAPGKALIFRIQAAEKTFATFELTVTNLGGHSSRPRADNAIYELADALTKISKYQFPVRSTEMTRAYFKSLGVVEPGPVGQAAAAFAENPDDENAIAFLSANPGTVGTLRTTCVATMLDAGHAENALPQSATATVNCRIFPGEGAELTAQRLKEAIGNPGVRFELKTDVTESPISDVPEEVFGAIREALKDRYPGVPLVPYMESGGTDGMHYRTLGYNTVAIAGTGIMPSQMFAHGLNERLSVKEFYDGLDYWIDIFKYLAE